MEKKRRRTNRNQERLLRAFEENPLVETACRRIGIARSTFYRWCDDDRKFYYQTEAARIKGREKMNDFAESKLLENVRIGLQTAIQYWLSNNSKIYQLNRPTNVRRMAQIQDEELKRNTEIMRIFNDDLEFDESVRMLGGDPEIINKAIISAIKGNLRWLIEHDV